MRSWRHWEKSRAVWSSGSCRHWQAWFLWNGWAGQLTIGWRGVGENQWDPSASRVKLPSPPMVSSRRAPPSSLLHSSKIYPLPYSPAPAPGPSPSLHLQPPLSPHFAEIITHRIEPRCREASAALAVNSRFSLRSPEGSCIWILLRRHCAHVSGLCTWRRPEGAHGPIWWKPWRETKASVFERWNLIGLCRWPRCGGKKKRRSTPEFVHIEHNMHTRRHLQNFKTKLFFSV